MKLYAAVRTLEQLECLIREPLVDALIIDCGCYEESKALLEDCDKEMILALPGIARQNRVESLRSLLGDLRLDGIRIENMDEAGLLTELGFTGSVIAGEFAYTYHAEAAAFWKDCFKAVDFIAPPELTIKELKQTEKKSGCRFIYKLYGYQLLMLTAQCLMKDHAGCLRDAKDHADGGRQELLRFSNDKKDLFYAVPDCSQCGTRIYYGKPTYMLDRLEELSCTKGLIDFTIENAAQTRGVLAACRQAMFGNPSVKEHASRGHYYKKID